MVKAGPELLKQLAMRAVRVHQFGGPEVLTVEDNVPIPACDSKQVLIRVMSAGVNPVDTYIRQGTYATLPPLPYTPGKDAAGTVEAVGSAVTKTKSGDRVFVHRNVISGAYAEYCTVGEDSVVPLPERLTFSQGAAIGVPYFTAYRALMQKCHAKPSQSVLIHGASGSVGLAAVQFARAYGLRVFGTAGSADGLKLVRETGAHLVFDHKQPGYTSKILEATKSEGVDLIIEMLSNVNLGKDLGLLKKNGCIAVVGSRGNVEINPRLMMQKESSVVGVALLAAAETEWEEMRNAVLSGLEQGWLTPVVDKEYPLEKVVQAHKEIIHSTLGVRGKLVLSLASQC